MTPSIMTLQFDLDSEKKQAALKATEYVQDGMVVGLGTGTTSKHLIIALGERVRSGLKIQAVPTSHDTAALARQSGIPLIESDNAWMIDVAIDGADQVDPALNLVKGGGGASETASCFRPKRATLSSICTCPRSKIRPPSR